MDVKRKKSGFTIVELLTVLAIIAMLVGLLVPALNLVRNIAKETKQKAQLTTIGLALTTFRNDDGEYPRSDWHPQLSPDYCGTQKLAEALLGWDLLGFHPDSHWQADGKSRDDTHFFYDPANPVDMDKRRGRYLELATTNAFKLGGPDGLFNNAGPLAPHTFVICDVFGVKKITIIQPGPAGKTDVFKAGTPILYYRANTSRKTIEIGRPEDRIYNCLDNQALISLKRLPDQIKDHRLGDSSGMFQFFYQEYIRDPKITARPWPYRPDSYILISAGADGEYGTNDDIRNFGN